jgi:hypothetical protein
MGRLIIIDFDKMPNEKEMIDRMKNTVFLSLRKHR